MTGRKALGEFMIMCLTLLAIVHAGKSIVGSVERQVFLHQQAKVLESGQVQARQINQELRDGLKNYRSSSGIERLARERLNLAGTDEVVVRITK